MTWTCPKCGKIHLSEYDMKRCSCQPSQVCPDCRGTGKKIEFLGPNTDCPRCNGSGKIFY